MTPTGETLDLTVTLHQLKSPLTAVSGFTESLLVNWDRLTDGEKQQKLIRIAANATEAIRILNLDVGWNIECVPLGCVSTLGVLIKDLSTTYPIFYEPSRYETNILTDINALAIILQHLVENAFAHGSPPVNITTLIRDAFVGISVSNYSESEISCTRGIGLTIVCQYAALMQGHITITKSITSTVFTVWLNRI